MCCCGVCSGSCLKVSPGVLAEELVDGEVALVTGFGESSPPGFGGKVRRCRERFGFRCLIVVHSGAEVSEVECGSCGFELLATVSVWAGSVEPAAVLLHVAFLLLPLFLVFALEVLRILSVRMEQGSCIGLSEESENGAKSGRSSGSETWCENIFSHPATGPKVEWSGVPFWCPVVIVVILFFVVWLFFDRLQTPILCRPCP